MHYTSSSLYLYIFSSPNSDQSPRCLPRKKHSLQVSLHYIQEERKNVEKRTKLRIAELFSNENSEGEYETQSGCSSERQADWGMALLPQHFLFLFDFTHFQPSLSSVALY